jgi:hypothetical protein
MQWLFELNDRQRSAVLATALGILDGTSRNENVSIEIREFVDGLSMALKEVSDEVKKEIPTSRKSRITFGEVGISPLTLERIKNNSELIASARKKANIKVQTPKVLSNTRVGQRKEMKKEISLFGWTIRSGNDR